MTAVCKRGTSEDVSQALGAEIDTGRRLRLIQLANKQRNHALTFPESATHTFGVRR